MIIVKKYVIAIFAAAIFSLLFFSYPIAILPPGLEGASFYIRLPSLCILALVSIPVLLFHTSKVKNTLKILVLLYATFIIGNLIKDTSNFEAGFQFLSYVVVPYAFVIYSNECRNWEEKVVNTACLLWGILIVYGILNYAQNRDVIGIAGNRNWMASAILCLIPWVWSKFARLITKLSPWLQYLL